MKGGIISSTADADKNKISTGTLTFEDIQNKADYKAGGAGIKVNKNNDAEYNEKGITPDIGMPASGEAESTTKATISKGTIEIRDKENQKQDINKLNRDNANSLNKLGEIFDKTKIEERQELANLFGELAYNEIHYMDGSNEQKALYHAVVGGIMSKLTSGDFLAGATAAGINKLVIEEIDKVAGGDPDKAQWVSAALGAVISGLVSGNAQAGGSAAASATKNNDDLEAEIAASNGESAEEIIEVDKMETIVDAEAEILKQYGVTNVFQLSEEEFGKAINKIASSLNVSVEKAHYMVYSQAILDNSIFFKDGLDGSYNDTLIQKAVVNASILAIKAEVLPNPREFTSDYVYSYIGAGMKYASGNIGYIMDREGNVYLFTQESLGVGFSTPILGGYGKGTIETNWKFQNGKDDKKFAEAIAGTSYGVGFSNVASSSVSKGENGGAITVEIGVESSVGGTIFAKRQASLIGNIYKGSKEYEN